VRKLQIEVAKICLSQLLRLIERLCRFWIVLPIGDWAGESMAQSKWKGKRPKFQSQYYDFFMQHYVFFGTWRIFLAVPCWVVHRMLWPTEIGDPPISQPTVSLALYQNPTSLSLTHANSLSGDISTCLRFSEKFRFPIIWKDIPTMLIQSNWRNKLSPFKC